jgi:excisionase family DNA binding protein
MKEPLLTVEEVARALNLRVRQVYLLAEDRRPDRRLPSVKLGRLLRFRPEDVRAYVDAHRTEVAS